jgi:hypothetical protein
LALSESAVVGQTIGEEIWGSPTTFVSHPPWQDWFAADTQTTFQYRLRDLGNLSKLHITSDHAGPSADWFLARVEVYEGEAQDNGPSWVFPY